MGRVFFTVLVCVLVLLAGPVAGRDNVRVGSPIDTISFSYCNGAQYDFGALTPNPDHYTYT